MKITKASNNLIELIKKFEGFSKIPYLCPANVATIGYGSTRYANGLKVTLKDNPITELQAIELLKNSCIRAHTHSHTPTHAWLTFEHAIVRKFENTNLLNKRAAPQFPPS